MNQHMGDFVTDAVEPILNRYKREAITVGTQAIMAQALVFGIIVFIIFDNRLRKYKR